jgi:hypothetical protein
VPDEVTIDVAGVDSAYSGCTIYDSCNNANGEHVLTYGFALPPYPVDAGGCRWGATLDPAACNEFNRIYVTLGTWSAGGLGFGIGVWIASNTGGLILFFESLSSPLDCDDIDGVIFSQTFGTESSYCRSSNGGSCQLLY